MQLLFTKEGEWVGDDQRQKLMAHESLVSQVSLGKGLAEEGLGW